MSENGNQQTRRFYTFNVQLNNETFQVRVWEDEMQCCPTCRVDLFDLKHRVVHFKPLVLGLEPQLLAVPVYVCSKCGYQVSATTPTKDSLQQISKSA